MSIVELVPTIEEARTIGARIVEQHPLVERVLLFGSIARGEATSRSDFDLVVLVSDDAVDTLRQERAAILQSAAAAERSLPHRNGGEPNGGDLLVRLAHDWDYVVANVSASLEAAVAQEALEIAGKDWNRRKRVEIGRPSTIVRWMPRTNCDVAADMLKSACVELGLIGRTVRDARHEEEEMAEAHSLSGSGNRADEWRRDRYSTTLSQAHLAIELAVKSVLAAEGQTPVRHSHKVLGLIRDVKNRSPRGALLATVEGLKTEASGPDELTVWRESPYYRAHPDWTGQMTPAHAAGYALAAARTAQIAADWLERCCADEDLDDDSSIKDRLTAARSDVERLIRLGPSADAFRCGIPPRSARTGF